MAAGQRFLLPIVNSFLVDMQLDKFAFESTLLAGLFACSEGVQLSFCLFANGTLQLASGRAAKDKLKVTKVTGLFSV